MLSEKCPHINTVESFYIRKEAATDKQLSDKQTVFPNKISRPSQTSKHNYPHPSNLFPINSFIMAIQVSKTEDSNRHSTLKILYTFNQNLNIL